MAHGTSECWGDDLLPSSPGSTPSLLHPSPDPDKICPETQPRAGAAAHRGSALGPPQKPPAGHPAQGTATDSSSGKLDLFAISTACEAVTLPTFISKYKGKLTVEAQFGSSIHEEPEGSENRWGLTRDTFLCDTDCTHSPNTGADGDLIPHSSEKLWSHGFAKHPKIDTMGDSQEGSHCHPRLASSRASCTTNQGGHTRTKEKQQRFITSL